MPGRGGVAGLFLFGTSVPASAHTTLSGGWEPDAWIVAALMVAMAALYARGARKIGAAGSGQAMRRHACLFAVGWIALAAALLSPLDALGEMLLSAHMLQHELIMLVAAPLLVAGRPLAIAAWAFRESRGGAVAAIARNLRRNSVWRSMESAPGAWALHLVAVWAWHAPVLFEASLRSDWVHAFQHTTFLGSALLFWWALLRRRRHGFAALYVLTTAIHTGLLGALLTFAAEPLYPAYLGTTQAWGLTALEDQQLGGLVMWVPAGIILLGAAGWLLFDLLDSGDRGAGMAPRAGKR
jgi:putative membrane protein